MKKAVPRTIHDKDDEQGCLYFGCHDDDDAAGCASADEDDDDADRCASADVDVVPSFSLKFENTIGSDCDVGFGGHVIANRNDNSNGDDDDGKHDTSITSACKRVGAVDISESEDGAHVGKLGGRSSMQSVGFGFDVEIPKSNADTTTNTKR